MKPRLDWKNLMDQWNNTVFNNERLVKLVSDKHKSEKWLGEKPATSEQIAQLEMQLQTNLPPSYREFIEFSNGWGLLDLAIYRLYSAQEVHLLYHKHRTFVDGYISGWHLLNPIEEEDNIDHEDVKNMPYLIQISEMGDNAFLLLNPNAVNRNGEWMAWFWASWSEGPTVYESFYDLMRDRYRKLLFILSNS